MPFGNIVMSIRYDRPDGAIRTLRTMSLETDWLDDFLAIVEHSGFSRAAEARHVTQPALSRRIRALEDWVGARLFLRTTHKVLLTPAGELFRTTAEDVLRRLASGRLEAKEQAESTGEQLRFAATNALALTFFPEWLRRVEVTLPFVASIQLVANHMEACERIMLQGGAQFLLGHHHPSVQTQLGPQQFLSHKVGTDVLIPVAAPTPGSKTRPLFTLPGTEAEPIPYLSYQPESGMGSIVAAVRRQSSLKAQLKIAFNSHLAKLLVTMAIDRRGMAWLPESLIAEHLASGSLVRAGEPAWDIPIEIHLFRARARMAKTAETFWNAVTRD